MIFFCDHSFHELPKIKNNNQPFVFLVVTKRAKKEQVAIRKMARGRQKKNSNQFAIFIVVYASKEAIFYITKKLLLWRVAQWN